MLEFNDEVRWILGRPNFTCIGVADLLRKSGMIIAKKAEDEQAATIYFYLEMYEAHGDGWRKRPRIPRNAPCWMRRLMRWGRRRGSDDVM